jgi:hypothetical protein
LLLNAKALDDTGMMRVRAVEESYQNACIDQIQHQSWSR